MVAVGLEPDGAMEVPGADQAGWYHPTDVRPGAASGSAVVAAHVDFGGRRGVFFDLRQVPVGAEVVVVDDAGTERRFVVDTRFQVDKDDLPAEELFRTGGPPTLTLITYRDGRPVGIQWVVLETNETFQVGEYQELVYSAQELPAHPELTVSSSSTPTPPP